MKKTRILQAMLGLSLLTCLGCSQQVFLGLLTWEEYNQMPKDSPYILELESNTGRLLYYGVFHTFEPDDSQLTEIEQRWAEFSPNLALSEGGISPLENNRNKSIRLYGEQGLLRFLAEKDNIPIRSIDPPRALQAKHLLGQFSTEKIKIYFVLRQARVNRMMGKNLDDLRYVNRILKVPVKSHFLNWPPSSLSAFETKVRQFFPDLEDWRKIPDEYFHSKETGKFLAEIHDEVTDFRDQYMIRILLNELKKGKRIFAVVGRSHVVSQEPVLYSFFEPKVTNRMIF